MGLKTLTLYGLPKENGDDSRQTTSLSTSVQRRAVRNLKSQTISSNNVPYRRETFREKHTIIEFDGGFNMVDGSFLSDRSDSKT